MITALKPICFALFNDYLIRAEPIPWDLKSERTLTGPKVTVYSSVPLLYLILVR